MPGLVWAGVGAAVLAALAGVVVLRGGDRPEDRGVDVPSQSATPSPVVPDELTGAPALSGRRDGDRVVFTWNGPAAFEPGDEWVWHRDDTEEYGHTPRRRLVLRTPDPVCVEVEMKRGSDTSSTARQCVT